MLCPLPIFLRYIQVGMLAFLALPAAAQVPNTLLHSIPAPPVGVHSGAQLGYGVVAVDGGYTVAGAPSDDTGGTDSGAVKVLNSMTGALLFLLPNPSPATNHQFGDLVAISGTRVDLTPAAHKL